MFNIISILIPISGPNGVDISTPNDEPLIGISGIY